MERDWPDRVYIRKKDRLIYTEILGPGSPLSGREAKEAFLLAMLEGVASGLSVDLGSNREGYVRREYFSDSELTVMKAVAVMKDGKLEDLRDKKEVFGVVERLAAAGLEGLRIQTRSGEFGSYFKKLELRLVEATRSHE